MSTTPPRPWVVASSADARVVPKLAGAAPCRGRRHVVIQLERKTKPQAPAVSNGQALEGEGEAEASQRN